MRRIYVVGHGRSYANWMEGKIVNDPEEANLLVFTGGEDVDPALYGKEPHRSTYYNTRRDIYEKEYFNYAAETGKAMIGICRGAQLFCALAGGILVQNQSHPYQHTMMTKEGKEIITTSMHHQRQYPWGGSKPRFKLLAWVKNLSPYNEGESREDNMTDDKPEVEIALYPDYKALAIQGHPEMAYPIDHPWERGLIEYCREQLNQLVPL